jgi:hypothetical protein
MKEVKTATYQLRSEHKEQKQPGNRISVAEHAYVVFTNTALILHTNKGYFSFFNFNNPHSRPDTSPETLTTSSNWWQMGKG